MTVTQQRRTSGARAGGPSGARGTGRFGAGAVGVGRGGGRGRVRRDATTRSATGDGYRGSARPAGRRGGIGQGNGAAKRTRPPQPSGLTARAAVLAMVLLGLLLAYAYPVRVYLGQQAQINSIEDQQRAQRHKIDELAQEREKWDDAEYVKSQVRSRLMWTAEGETPYRVVGGGVTPTNSESNAANFRPRERPWYGKLWGSVTVADRK